LAVAASPDNQQFATASQDGTVRVWDYAGKNLQTLYSQSGAVNSVAFSPDSKRIATANTDGTVQIYLLDISELLKLARSRTNRSLTPDECERYFQTTTCPPMP
jgi:WD40 repeat protein